MPENQAQAATTTTGDQASQNNQQQGSGAAAGAQGSDQASQAQRSAAEYEQEIKRLREEAAGHRTKARDLETKLKQYDDEKLSESEKLSKRAQDAEEKITATERKIREIETQRVIERQARKLNIVDEDAAYRLLDHSKIEFDADGKPTNIEALLTGLVKDKPYLLGAPAGSGASATNPAAAQRGGLTMDDIKKMSRQEINARWPEVQKVMNAQKNQR